VSRVQRPARHSIGHFGDGLFQAKCTQTHSNGMVTDQTTDTAHLSKARTN